MTLLWTCYIHLITTQKSCENKHGFVKINMCMPSKDQLTNLSIAKQSTCDTHNNCPFSIWPTINIILIVAHTILYWGTWCSHSCCVLKLNYFHTFEMVLPKHRILWVLKRRKNTKLKSKDMMGIETPTTTTNLLEACNIIGFGATTKLVCDPLISRKTLNFPKPYLSHTRILVHHLTSKTLPKGPCLATW